MIYKIKIINLRIKKNETAYRESCQIWVALRKVVSSIYKLQASRKKDKDRMTMNIFAA